MATPPSDLGTSASEPPGLNEERTLWLTTLYEANARMVFSTCRRLLNNSDDAADATHEVFLRAAASLHTAPDGKDAAAWLTTVARNHCLDVIRRRRRFQSAIAVLGADVIHAESDTEVVDRQLAQAVLDQLAVRDRVALWESHVEQRPVGEIAERLGLSYLAAAQLLSRARRRAALVAAELAAIFILVRLGLRRGRMALQNNAQPVAAFLAVPVVMTALVVTTSPLFPPTVSSASAPKQAVLPPGRSHRSGPTGPATPNPNVTLPPSGNLTPAPGIHNTSAPIAAVPATVSQPQPGPSPAGKPHKHKHPKPGDRDDRVPLLPPRK